MLKNNRLRIIVDVNGWVSSLLSSKFQVRLEVVFGAEYRLICSGELFCELDKAIRKPHLAKRINQTHYEELIDRLTDAELVDVRSTVEICRDPKDNFLLALAKDGNADYLITGDEDLLVMKEFGKTKIVTLREFETEHL
ncbi:MAG: putative toxin-antitoxin system toxin component, PIN family [Planctomycetaceae bacterium]|nr:putative toxin-antitoxin system toxin component, PIN family [Planctomycetaceae bacterium]